MFVRKIAIGGLLLTLLSLALPVKYALACSCVQPPSNEEAVADYDAVFDGTVVKVYDPHGDDAVVSSGRTITYTFEVDNVVKGDVEDPQLVKTAADSATCGFRFKSGLRYQVYADEYGKVLTTDSCSNTHKLPPLSNQDDPTTPTSENDNEGVVPTDPGDGGPLAPVVWVGTGAVLALGAGMLFLTRRRDLRGSVPPRH